MGIFILWGKNKFLRLKMEKIMKKLVFCLSTLALVGCKTDIEKDVSLNKLLNEPLSLEQASLSIEIPSCNDFNDSRQPSNSLITLQNKISVIFPESQFKDCYRNKFDSYALFDIPIGVGIVDKKFGNQSIPDLSLINSPEHKAPLIVYMSENLRNRLETTQKNQVLSKLDLSIILNIKNDLKDRDKNTYIVASYINDEPMSDGLNIKFHQNSGKTLKIKLSDVSTDQLIKNGVAPLMRDKE